MRINVDRDICCGAGMCVLTAPDIFEQSDEDGLVVLLRQPDAAEADIAGEATQLCPSGAITVADEGDPAN
ncbi:ferredoxin [Actinopolymorpha sp. NPDC004070]|uniref:ferredoxin n=1 Tax=Actinopolymorpha sp. NPDC004070 TaxID=3154548 RepID=UPI0033BE7485